MGIGDHPARRLERRWAPRYSFRANLEIEWGSAVLRGSTRDISASGMFIEAVDPLWVGAGFTARLTLDRPVRLDCFVKRIQPGKGMGGSLVFPYVSQIYPPLELDLMLVFFGGFFFVALAIAVLLERRARNHLELEVLKRVYAGFIPLPWILAATLLANGALDAKENATY